MVTVPSLSAFPEELARHVGGAPCVAHAAAVASSALGSLLKGRTEEATAKLGYTMMYNPQSSG
jgi:hypothetical protein